MEERIREFTPKEKDDLDYLLKVAGYSVSTSELVVKGDERATKIIDILKHKVFNAEIQGVTGESAVMLPFLESFTYVGKNKRIENERLKDKRQKDCKDYCLEIRIDIKNKLQRLYEEYNKKMEELKFESQEKEKIIKEYGCVSKEKDAVIKGLNEKIEEYEDLIAVFQKIAKMVE